jgi:8-hydroxy-5-deazaflavin:NADPH oxidoreductase
MSSISIIGLGNMASALADRALAGGNTVEIIGRDQAKANELAGSLGGATVTAGRVIGPVRTHAFAFIAVARTAEVLR